MTKGKREPLQQFAAVEELLTRWLQVRRTLLGKYTELAVTTRAAVNAEQLARQQREFCGLLVDYVSAGHFEVYLELIEEAESFADGSGGLAGEIMPSIGNTTEFILAYDEKYTGRDGGSARLERDLCALGEVLESRFALEDRLIAGLHNSHRRQLR